LRLILLGLGALWLTTQLPPTPLAAGPEATGRQVAASSPAAIATGVVLALGLLLSWPATGHPSAGSQVALATPVDVVHLAAMCVWLGGLAVLSLTLLPLRRGPDLARALPVFSRVAFSSVVVLIVTGVYQSWREVGTLPAFTGTAYGRLLLVKLIAFVGLIAVGNLARLYVRRHYGGAPAAVGEAVSGPAAGVTASEPALVGASGRRATAARAASGRAPLSAGDDPGHSEPIDPLLVGRLRRSLLVEVLIGVVVLGLTAVLVAMAPARDTYHPPARATLALPSRDRSRRRHTGPRRPGPHRPAAGRQGRPPADRSRGTRVTEPARPAGQRAPGAFRPGRTRPLHGTGGAIPLRRPLAARRDGEDKRLRRGHRRYHGKNPLTAAVGASLG